MAGAWSGFEFILACPALPQPHARPLAVLATKPYCPKSTLYPAMNEPLDSLLDFLPRLGLGTADVV
jgi:hypothetical protein